MATTQENTELSTARSNGEELAWQDPITTEIEQPPLPPTDTGREAWLVLAGCTVIQLPVWGMLPE